MSQSHLNCHVIDFHCQGETLQEITRSRNLFWDIHNSGSEFVYIMYCVSNSIELQYIFFFNSQIYASFFTQDFSIVSSNIFQAGCLKNYFVNRFLEYRILWAIARRMKAIKKTCFLFLLSIDLQYPILRW